MEMAFANCAIHTPRKNQEKDQGRSESQGRLKRRRKHRFSSEKIQGENVLGQEKTKGATVLMKSGNSGNGGGTSYKGLSNDLDNSSSSPLG